VINGIKLLAIRCDNEAILNEFAERHKIDYPLRGDVGQNAAQNRETFPGSANQTDGVKLNGSHCDKSGLPDQIGQIRGLSG
jgi:hypothetical protein